MALENLKHIVVFEHQKLIFDLNIVQEATLLDTLVAYHGEKCPYFSLIRNGVKFCEYVGVLQIGNTLIEILPKADQSNDTSKWQALLINMIRTVGGFPVQNGGAADLKLKHNSVLDLYFELLVAEIESLMHRGLVKKYKVTSYNANALKGKLAFSKHIRHNLVHKEKFFIETNHYTQEHELHAVLYAAIQLVVQLNKNSALKSRLGSILLNFPEQCDLKITQQTFQKIVLNRKTAHYQRALDIAELILLRYHPDISNGKRNVLALLFDMNALWEQFVLRVLQMGLKDFKINGQVSKNFWKGSSMRSSMRPDILLTHSATNTNIVLDTKWKNINSFGPSSDDLRQMYVYSAYFNAQKVALVYPGEGNSIDGQYYSTDQKGLEDRFCHLIKIPVEGEFGNWKENLVKKFEGFLLN